MSDKPTISVGGLVLNKDGSGYLYEVEGPQGLRLRLHPGWKHDVATATVQFPKDCNSVQSAGSFRTAIEGALNYMKQEIEQEVRRANKRLADFNAQHSDILALLGELDAQVDQPPPEAS
jgi:hypothetical protein